MSYEHYYDTGYGEFHRQQQLQRQATFFRRQILLGGAVFGSASMFAASTALAVKASTVGAFLAANASFLCGSSATMTSLALGIGITFAAISGVILATCVLAVCCTCIYRERSNKAKVTSSTGRSGGSRAVSFSQ